MIFFIFHRAKVTLLHPSLDTENFLSFMLQFMLDDLSVFNLFSQSLLQGIRVKRHTWKAIPSAVIQGVPLLVKICSSSWVFIFLCLSANLPKLDIKSHFFHLLLHLLSLGNWFVVIDYAASRLVFPLHV